MRNHFKIAFMEVIIMPTRPRCPKCNSRNSAFVLWGRTMWRDDLREKLDHKELELGGCFVSKDSCIWHCNDCGHYYHKLGLREFSEATRKGKKATDHIRAIIYSEGNKHDIDKSNICGCYYCLELLNHYIEKFGAEYLGMLHVYQFFIDEISAQKLLEVYSYEWN